ncbi:hypothetical protein INT45_012995 [Circinella minor]|uniref:Heterokaryon incompatibility domain-containing protein n=1 Tax=Circinella minor TaxID=1195481 RepID=A0A8H7RY49_9FUNG|nr:hypothetical protein INT45_012995 [Circinella minor]
MYITYCRNQKSVDLVDTTSYRLNVTGGEYRPTWLMRVSDWKRVPGKEAVNGYHTISYCWEQSGEVSNTANIRYVRYDELLQQVCKDFQVEYVWYDKICIDQSDPKAKSREIKQMHKIYRNARYTIAMIPEVRLYNPQDFEEEALGFAHKAQDYVTDDVWYSCWFKRSWTLEEVMMARRILIIGANTNMFQHSLHTTDVPTTVDIFSGKLLDFEGTERNKVSVNQALAFAHFRTSTKPHDMIYALKNTIEEINSYVEKRNRMRNTKNNDHELDLSTADKDTVLLESVLNMQNATGANMTHYHQPEDDLLTHIRPLTLTEDCEECIVLPILLQLRTPVYKRTGEGVPSFIIKDYDHDYCLPVLRECIEGAGRYRAVGIYYVGVRDHRSTEPPSKLMDYIGRDDINFDDPKEIISALFENDCHEVSKEFIIE